MGNSSIHKTIIMAPNPWSTKISMTLFFVACIGLLFWYVVDLPIKDQSAEIMIPYYAWLPKWVTDIFMATIILFITSFIFYNVKKSFPAVIIVSDDQIAIQSELINGNRSYTDLVRINIVAQESFRRSCCLEFISKRHSPLTITFSSKEDFEDVFDKLQCVVPKGLELNMVSFVAP